MYVLPFASTRVTAILKKENGKETTLTPWKKYLKTKKYTGIFFPFVNKMKYKTWNLDH